MAQLSRTSEFAGVQYLAFALWANIITGKREHGRGRSLPSDEFNFVTVCTIAVDDCSSVALLQVVFICHA